MTTFTAEDRVMARLTFTDPVRAVAFLVDAWWGQPLQLLGPKVLARYTQWMRNGQAPEITAQQAADVVLWCWDWCAMAQQIDPDDSPLPDLHAYCDASEARPDRPWLDPVPGCCGTRGHSDTCREVGASFRLTASQWVAQGWDRRWRPTPGLGDHHRQVRCAIDHLQQRGGNAAYLAVGRLLGYPEDEDAGLSDSIQRLYRSGWLTRTTPARSRNGRPINRYLPLAQEPGPKEAR